MKHLAILALLGLAACAEPVAKADGPDFGFGEYFDKPGEFAAWLQVGCYEGQTRVFCSD